VKKNIYYVIGGWNYTQIIDGKKKKKKERKSGKYSCPV